MSEHCPIVPLFENVMVVRTEAEERKVGLIYVPDTVKEKPVECEVVSIGSEVTQLQVGDQCIVSRYAGAEFEWNNQKYVVIRENEVLGVVRHSA
jgi:chaperonin GroES